MALHAQNPNYPLIHLSVGRGNVSLDSSRRDFTSPVSGAVAKFRAVFHSLLPFSALYGRTLLRNGNGILHTLLGGTAIFRQIMAQMTRNCTALCSPPSLPCSASWGSGSRPSSPARFIVPGNIYATWRDKRPRLRPRPDMHPAQIAHSNLPRRCSRSTPVLVQRN